MKMTLMMCFNQSILQLQQTEIFRESSGWIIDLVIDQTRSISKYNLLSQIKLDHPRKRLINIQNFDDS